MMLHFNRKKNALWFFVLLSFAFLGVYLFAAEKTVPEERALAQKYQKQGNYRDAWELYQKLAVQKTNSAQDVVHDLQQGINCLHSLNRVKEMDAFLESVLKAHGDEPRVLWKLAESYIHAPHHGVVIDGQFIRGPHRGHPYVNSQELDRLTALRLMERAVKELAGKDDTELASDIYAYYARVLMVGREGGNAWQLQSLTDLNEVPDYDTLESQPSGGFRGRFGGGFGRGMMIQPVSGPEGAPVDEAGNPVYYRVSESFAAAVNDGQRWRWMLDQSGKLNTKREQEALYQVAQFNRSQFGVQTLQNYMPYFFRQRDSEGEQEEEQVNPFSLETLKPTETLARLATGIKRFTLPDDVNFILLYQKVEVLGKSTTGESALRELTSIFKNRRQYPESVKYLKQSIETYGDSDHRKQSQLQQIIGNWGQFEPNYTQVAGQGAKVDYRFRNGKQVKFEAYEIHVEKLLDDVKAYLKSNPNKLDWNKINIGNIGYRIVTEHQEKYQGELVSRWDLDLTPFDGHRDRRVTVTTPLQNAGAYLLVAKMNDGNTSRIVVWLDDTAIVHKRMADKSFYFVADARTGKPIPGANLEFFGYQQKRVDRNQYQVTTENFAEQTDANGQAFPSETLLKPRYQWITIARTKSGRFAYTGFDRFWYSNQRSDPGTRQKIYGITDRPVYRPGQRVDFKFWARNVSYDLTPEQETQFANQSVTLKLNGRNGKTVFEKTLTTDEYGGVNGDWTIPKDADLGPYTLGLNLVFKDPARGNRNRTIHGSVNFRVEEYKKPEYEVLVEAPDKPVMLGEAVTAKIKAKYYFGSPVTNAQVTYKVTRTAYDQQWYPYNRWDWLYGSGYWWFGRDYYWYPGWTKWGCIAPGPWWIHPHPGPPEVVLSNTVDIGSNGEVEIKIDTALAKAIHGDEDHKYEITAEVVDESRRTIVGKGSVFVAREPFKVFAWMNRGYYRVGDTMLASFKAQTLDSQPVKGTGKLVLYRVTYTEEGTPKETAVQEWDLNPSEDGSAEQKIAATQAGEYRIAYTVTDQQGHQIEGGYLFSIRGEGFDGKEYRFNDLELVLDKKQYQPGEKVRLLINTNQPGSTVMLFVRPVGGIYPKPHVLQLDGKSTVYEFDLTREDLPNLFVEAFTVHQGKVHTVARQIAVPPEEQVVNLEVEPSETEYLPGQEATLKLKATDEKGQPIKGSLVVSVYDKSVEYISGGPNVRNIKDFFWKWKRSHHPSTSDNLNRSFHVLMKSGEAAMQMLGAFGHLVEASSERQSGWGLNGSGGGFGGGAMEGADKLIQSKARAMPMAAGMAGRDSFAVASAAPADSAAVVEPVVREKFADTAFWNAAINTDAEGRAQVSFKMPENLTSWKIRSWAMGQGTQVGEGMQEVVTRKNVIVRLQAPRFFTETDEVVLSAIVHNYLKTSKQVQVVLELDGDTLEPLDDMTRTVEIEANGEQRVDWRVKAARGGFAVIRMKALTDEESDAMQMTFPVKVHGILKTDSFTGTIPSNDNRTQISFQIPNRRKIEESRLELRYSPSLAGAMVDALPYLVYSPHKTTDNTLYRFLPTVMTQNILKRMGLNLKEIEEKQANLNAQEIGDDKERAAQWKRYENNPVFSQSEVDLLVKQGVADLTSMQLADGGWGWFSGWQERSSPYFTARIVQGLSLAQENGVALVPGTLERGIEWLKTYQQQELQKLLNAPSKKKPYKESASNLDAYVFLVLVNHKVVDQKMYDFLYRDRTKLSVYALGMLGLASHEVKNEERLAMIMQNMDQFLVQDPENQTAYLNLANGSWWYWYGSEVEANAYYLKLLCKADPQNPKAAQLVKYLLNNRKHATYWNSVSDTAIAVEALAEYFKASGEDQPNLTVEIFLDGQKQKEVKITPENLFSFDNKFVLEGEALTAGAHRLEIRKQGAGPLYYNTYVTYFTKENFITAAGLEIKVARRYYKLVPLDAEVKAAGSRGQAVDQKVEKYQREEILSDTVLKSGDLIEVELIFDSKNDYVYLVFEDFRAAGTEMVSLRSGYIGQSLGAYQENRDDRTVFYLRRLPRGKNNLKYQLRAEIPGHFSGLPTKGFGMYAPELKANSDEIKVQITD